MLNSIAHNSRSITDRDMKFACAAVGFSSIAEVNTCNLSVCVYVC